MNVQSVPLIASTTKMTPKHSHFGIPRSLGKYQLRYDSLLIRHRFGRSSSTTQSRLDLVDQWIYQATCCLHFGPHLTILVGLKGSGGSWAYFHD